MKLKVPKQNLETLIYGEIMKSDTINFVDDAVYVVKFRHRFRVRQELFLRIVDDIKNRFPYFQQRVNGRGQKGFSSIQKCTRAVRQKGFHIFSALLTT